MWHRCGNERSKQTITPRALVVSIDVVAGMVDEVHVVDLGAAGRHACEARQAGVEVLHRCGIRGIRLRQHGANQIDASARRLVLIMRDYIGGTCRGTESEVIASLYDAIGLSKRGVCELRA